MDDQQTEPCLRVDLPVRVWGMTAAGRPFSQSAHALNISSEGALISGIESELQVGDVIGVQFEEKKTRCTVISVMNTGPVKKNQVGIELVRPTIARLHTLRCPRTSDHPLLLLHRWLGSIHRRRSERPSGTPCRTGHRNESWAIPSLLRATPSATSEHLRGLLDSSSIPQSSPLLAFPFN